MRPTVSQRVLAQDTAMCMRPMLNTAEMAPAKEWSSPTTAPIMMPPNRNSSTRSNGAIMLAVRRPINHCTANSSTR